MDFYRLNDKTNIYDLISSSHLKSYIIIEWPEKLIEFIPEKRLNIKLSFVDDDDLRKIILANSMINNNSNETSDTLSMILKLQVEIQTGIKLFKLEQF